MTNSLRIRLTLFFVTVTVTPLLLLAGLIVWQGFIVLENQTIALQQVITGNLATEIKAFLDERQNELQLLVEVQNLNQLNQSTQRELLGGLMSRQSVYQELTLVDQEGQEQIRLSRVKAVLKTDLTSRAESETFLKPINSGKTYYGPIKFDETTYEPLMTIAVPSIDLQSGQATSVLIAEIRFKKVWDLISDFRRSKGQNEGEQTYVIDRQKNIVAHRDHSVVLRGTTFDLPVTQGGGHFRGLSGSDVILAATPIEFGNQDLIAVAEEPYAEATAWVRQLVTLVGIITAIALGVAVVTGLGLIRQIVRPVEKLSASVRAVQAGDLSQTVEVNSQDEIGQLAQAFNSMTTQLRQKLKDLRLMAAILDNTSDLVSVADMQGEILYFNEAGLKMTGRAGQDSIALSISDFHPPEMVQQMMTEHIPMLMEHGVHSFESLLKHVDGHTIPVSQVAVLIRNETGEPEAMATIIRDLSEQKQAEMERARLQQEVIEAQNQLIRDLSSPVIPLLDRIIVMPLIGSIDSLRARDITRTLLAGISQHRARVVILDITGVSLVDSGVASHLNKTIQAARLKGARAIVTGVSDAVAETVVDLGISWEGVQTLRDLQTGLVAALNSVGLALTAA